MKRGAAYPVDPRSSVYRARTQAVQPSSSPRPVVPRVVPPPIRAPRPPSEAEHVPHLQAMRTPGALPVWQQVMNAADDEVELVFRV
jgi:hypothetical protein